VTVEPIAMPKRSSLNNKCSPRIFGSVPSVGTGTTGIGIDVEGITMSNVS
jgi:hypothetical protein